jgi:hypothetical protein
MTPMIEYRSPLNVTIRPMTSRAPPNRRCQSE